MAFEIDTLADSPTIKWEQTGDELRAHFIGTIPSAYQLWLQAGNTGTQLDFFAAITGAPGKSAYQVWLDAGNTGDLEAFFTALEGKSAYEIWLELGNTGTPADFIEALRTILRIRRNGRNVETSIDDGASWQLLFELDEVKGDFTKWRLSSDNKLQYSYSSETTPNWQTIFDFGNLAAIRNEVVTTYNNLVPLAQAVATNKQTTDTNAFNSNASAVRAEEAAKKAEQSESTARTLTIDMKNANYGALPSDPVARPDGTPCQEGDSYVRTTAPKGYYVFVDGQWGKSAVDSSLVNAKLTKAGDTMTGTIKSTAKAALMSTPAGETTNLYRLVTNLVSYRNGVASFTGAIVFFAPSINNVMHTLHFRGYNNAAGQALIDFAVTGYTTSTETQQASVVHYGEFRPRVRWGRSASQVCVVVGDASTVWSFADLAIIRAHFGYSGVTDAYMQGWTAELRTDFTGITFTEPTDNSVKWEQTLRLAVNATNVFSGATSFNNMDKGGVYAIEGSFANGPTGAAVSPYSGTLVNIERGGSAGNGPILVQKLFLKTATGTIDEYSRVKIGVAYSAWARSWNSLSGNISFSNSGEGVVLSGGGKLSDDAQLRTVLNVNASRFDMLSEDGTATLASVQQNALILPTKGNAGFDAASKGWLIPFRPDNFATAAAQNDLEFYFWNGSTYVHSLSLNPDGSSYFSKAMTVDGATTINNALIANYIRAVSAQQGTFPIVGRGVATVNQGIVASLQIPSGGTEWPRLHFIKEGSKQSAIGMDKGDATFGVWVGASEAAVGTKVLSIGDDGNFWTPMFGWMSNFMATKSNTSHLHDDRYDVKNAWTGHDLTVGNYGNPQVRFYYPGVIHAGLLVGGDGHLYYRNADSGAVYHRFGSNGVHYFNGGAEIHPNGNMYMPWAGQWLSDALGAKANLGGAGFWGTVTFPPNSGPSGGTPYIGFHQPQYPRRLGYIGNNDGGPHMHYVNETGGYHQFYNTTGGWTMEVAGNFVRPINNRGSYCGGASYRWEAVYAQNGAIQTSDETKKTNIRHATDAEIRVAQRLRREFRFFQWKDRVEAEGVDGARIHAGAISQRVGECFRQEGLDPGRYSLWCEDDEFVRVAPEDTILHTDGTYRRVTIETVTDENGNTIEREILSEPIAPAEAPSGKKIYSLRYDELHSFMLAAVSSELEQIKQVALGLDPNRITDRQFWQGLAKYGVITMAEARAAVRIGQIPQAMMDIFEDPAFQSMLPESMKDMEDLYILVEGALTYERNHPLTELIAGFLGWTEEETDEFWAFCASLV